MDLTTTVKQTIFGLGEMQRTYQALQSMETDRPIQERLLQRLAVTYRVSDQDLRNIPRKGPVVVVANHPFGILEGAILATLLGRIRPDVKFLANEILTVIPEIRDSLIPANRGGRKSIEFLESGGCLVVFPAGEVSHFQWRERAVLDSQWNTGAARLIEIASRSGAAIQVVPIHISGSNGALFQLAGMVHPTLRTALLARELLNKKNRFVDLRVGSPITNKKLLEIPTAEERTEYLRWRTYLLANRSEYKARTSAPLPRKRRQQLTIAPPVDAAVLAAEIGTLTPVKKSGDLDVYLSPASAIPNVLQEIGRLREVTFRAAGEGTGKATDLDRFDAHYLHLFVWNPKKQEIVGAYRLAGTECGQDGLYTATLFKYGEAFLEKLGPAIELGRSFVRAEYQKGFAPLLALWKGIGSYLSQNPRYKVLFGPVSISNQYQSISRELMVTFLERHASLRDWTGLVTHRNPFRKRGLPRLPIDVEDLSDVVADLEPSRAGVPVLLRQYLRLGGKLLGFNVDPEFADSLDGLILVDLTKTDPKLLERYMKGTHGTH